MFATLPPTPAMVIDFLPNGVVEAMHRDHFSLAFLGKQNVRRASELRFDENTQDWYIELLNEQGIGLAVPEQARGFGTYDEARKMEVRWLEMARLHGIAPLCDEGVAMLAVLRKTFD